MGNHIPASQALAAWEKFSEGAKSLCYEMMLCGSLRRGQPMVSDVDCVVRPVRAEDGTIPLHVFIMEFADKEPPQWVLDREVTYKRPNQRFVRAPLYPLDPKKPQVSVRFFVDGVQIDLYESWTEDDFWPQVVVRTGPARRRGVYGPGDPGAMQNPALATRAQRRGLRLSMSGQGLVKDGIKVGFESEESFFEVLALPYCPPQLRDDPGWIALIWSGVEVEPDTVYAAGFVPHSQEVSL